MSKKWFISIDGKAKGPYTLQELKTMPRISPDTLVCPEGGEKWEIAGHFSELHVLFEEESQDTEEDEIESLDSEKESYAPVDDELALDSGLDPIDPNFIYLYALLIILILYLYMRSAG